MRPSIKLSLLCGALLCASVLSPAARADITGDTLHFTFRYPTITDVYRTSGDFVADGMSHDFEGEFTYAASGSQLSFFGTGYPSSRLYGPADFSFVSYDGPVITDFTQSLGGYTLNLDAASTALGLFNVNPILTNNRFQADFSGWRNVAGSSLIFDLIAPPPPPPPPPPTAATPEPSSLALLGTGILGALGAVRRRARS